MSEQGTQRRAHIPSRTCAGCGQRDARSEMRRFALGAPGRLEWKERGGRGSYLHATRECEAKFLANKKSVRGLRARIAVEVREQLLATAEIRGI